MNLAIRCHCTGFSFDMAKNVPDKKGYKIAFVHTYGLVITLLAYPSWIESLSFGFLNFFPGKILSPFLVRSTFTVHLQMVNYSS